MEFRKVNITLPVQLFEKAKQLVDKGLYSNFSDLVRSSIRKELKEEQKLVEEKSEWRTLVESIRNDLKKSELGKLSKAEILRRLRRSREKIYDEEYG